MSKSLGNFLTIRDLLTKHHAQTLRFFIVRSHYRSELTYTPDQLEDAQQGLKKLYGTLHRVSVPVGSAVSVPSIDWNDPWASAFKEAMDQDFGTPKAVAVLFDLAAQVTKTASAELAHLLKQLGGVLGLLQEEPTHFLQDLSLTSVDVSTIDSLIAERAQLKAQKQFARADQIRSGLLAQGIALKDGPQGTSWERV
jgi:cysteinyl-tRNA synthetase